MTGLKNLSAIVACLLVFAGNVFAQPFLKLPSIIGDHMVLQENSTVKIWGWADPNTTVTVTPSWAEPVTTKSDYDTRWCVEIMTPGASSEPKNISVSTGKKVAETIDDVLIGQVWLCSGQSNMNWSAANGIKDMRAELQTEMNSEIRLFTVRKYASPYPQEDCDGEWTVCTPESALYFSAVGYFFGKRLASELGQPVGLVNSSWGGTPIEVWTPPSVMTQNNEMVESWKGLSYSSRVGWDIGCAYNAMIHPLLDTEFSGVIWYQGEANRKNHTLYGQEFKMMIESWRDGFGKELPFYFVQIAPNGNNEERITGALLREQQTWVGDNVHKTGMVIISDQVDDVKDIHPRYKREVGNRLANWALANDYGKEGIKFRHADYESMKIDKSKIIISFKNAEGGLVCPDKEIAELEICDESMNFVPARGKILPDGKLAVWNKSVKHPVAVRYCFRDMAIGNLFDSAGLPVASFRTDSKEQY